MGTQEDQHSDQAVCASDEHSGSKTPRDPAPARVIERAANILRAAGDPARMRLLETLTGGEYCVSELAAESGDGMSTISQRLKVLRTEGLISRRRDGKHIYYTLRDQHVVDLIRIIIEHAAEEVG